MAMDNRLLVPRAKLDPRMISGLQGWWDAADRSTLFDADTGGSIVADNGAVGRWEDKSGNGRHMTQGTANNRPLRKASVKNGRDVVRFDGTNDRLAVPNSTATFKFFHSLASTVFLVMSRPSTGDTVPLLGTFGGGSGDVGYVLFGVNGTSTNDKITHVVGRGVGGTLTVLNASGNDFVPSGFNVISVVTDSTNATAASRATMRVNNGAATAGNTWTNAASTANSLSDLHMSGPVGFVAADYCEVLLYDSILTPSQRSNVERYLASKWGIALA